MRKALSDCRGYYCDVRRVHPGSNDDPEPFYGEVPELEGVWATGKTLEDCRRELQEVIEGWIALKLRFGHPIPAIGGHSINASAEPVSIVE